MSAATITHRWSMAGYSNPPWLHYKLADGSFASGYAERGALPDKLTPCDEPSPFVNLRTGESFGEWIPISEWLGRRK